MVGNAGDLSIVDKGNASQPCKPFESDVELSDGFWASVEYCGYLRCTYEPGTLTMTGLFMNEAYASLAGLDREEMVRR